MDSLIKFTSSLPNEINKDSHLEVDHRLAQDSNSKEEHRLDNRTNKHTCKGKVDSIIKSEYKLEH